MLRIDIERSFLVQFYKQLLKMLSQQLSLMKSSYVIVQCCWDRFGDETWRRLSDRLREHLRDVERNDKDASKSVARLSLHLGSSESPKTLEQQFIFQIGTLNPHGINEHFSFN